MAKKYSSFMDLVENEFSNVFILDDQRNESGIKVIPTGAISLDISIGVGGIPVGRFTEIYGSESTGKSTLALGISKSAIELGHRVLYIDPEMGMDYKYAQQIVGDILTKENFVRIGPETMEQSLDIAEKGIESKEFGLIILDSIGSMSPRKVKDDDLTDANVALLSRIMTTFVQRNTYSLKDSNTAFIGINQIRDKIGSYIRSYETPGGHAWKHVLSLRIMLSKAEDIKADSEPIGMLTKFTIKKNKVAKPFRTFTIPIMFGKGIDTLRDLVEFSTMLGVLERGGSYYKFEGEVIGQGLVKTMNYLEENADTLDKIKEMCYNRVIG